MSAKWIKVNVRTSPRIRSKLKKVVAEVGQAPALAGHKGVLTQEAFIAATWLWMDTLDAEELAAHVAPFLATAEEALGHSGPGGRSIEPLPPVKEGPPNEAAKRQARKRGAG